MAGASTVALTCALAFPSVGGAIPIVHCPPPSHTAPTAAFTVTPPSSVVGDSVGFDATASHPGTTTTWTYNSGDAVCEPIDSDNPIVHYVWNFGDGTTATTSTPTTTHAYNAPGSYTVTLSTETVFRGSTPTSHGVSVSKAGTATTLAGSTNSSNYGDAVTFTATVASPAASGTPTGVVTFTVDGISIGSGNVNSGQASISTGAIEPGSHVVTATYNGDANHTSSNSGSVSLTVNKLSSATALVSSSNPSPQGGSVTFTATVAGSAVGTPSGSVQFQVDGVNVGAPVALVGGTASYSTSSLAAGSHSISAIYSGDNHYKGSSSSPWTQKVSSSSSPSGGSTGGNGGSNGGNGGSTGATGGNGASTSGIAVDHHKHHKHHKKPKKPRHQRRHHHH